MLREKGYNVSVKNAGKSGDTTSGMLKRLDSAIPSGTRIVILDTSGGFHNDVKTGVSLDQTRANWSAIKTRLRSRGITVIPVDFTPLQTTFKQAHSGHLNVEGHRLLATRLLPEVIRALAGTSSR